MPDRKSARTILVLNAGSSSLKCELFAANDEGPTADPLWIAQADWKVLPGNATLKVRNGELPETEQVIRVESLSHTVEQLLHTLLQGERPILKSFSAIGVVGHRVVHGGGRFRESTLINDAVRNGIRDLAPFAPLHNPLALEAIDAAGQVTKSTPQVAVFDTSFHETLPPESYIYPGPRAWLASGLRRYGFHGISHRYISDRTNMLVGPLMDKPLSELRVISCHLGNGCSLCAIRGGKSVETTMGFTPLEGLVMGSRSGTVDPGLLLYLLRHDHDTVDQLDHILNYESGLKGLSGISGDMRQVAQAARQGNAEAAEALRVYTYRLAYFISALVPALGGLDALVFAAGVGENSAQVRSDVCQRLAFLGIRLDDGANAATRHDGIISPSGHIPVTAVIHTRENLQIARECFALMRK